jgi:hypothetical protein
MDEKKAWNFASLSKRAHALMEETFHSPKGDRQTNGWTKKRA